MAMNFHDYPYTDLHEMNLDWCIAKVKELTAAWAVTRQDWTDTKQAWEDMKDYINNYFNNLNVQTEINNKLDALVADGTLSDLISPFVASGLPSVVADQLGDVVAAQIGSVVAAQISAVVSTQLPSVVATETAGQAAAWLAEHVHPDTGYVIDDSLTIAGAAADAKATGDKIGELKSDLGELKELGIGVEFTNFTMTDDYYINPNDGKLSEHQGIYSSSSVINLDDANTIYTTLGSGTGIAFYDGSNNFISSITVSSITKKWWYLNPPNNAKFFRFTNKIGGTSPMDNSEVKCIKLFKQDTFDKFREEVKENTELLKDFHKIRHIMTEQKYVNATNGNVVDISATTFKCSDMVEIIGDVLYLYTCWSDVSNSYAFYNDFGRYISGGSGDVETGKDNYVLRKIEIPSGAKYIRYTNWSNTDDSYIMCKQKEKSFINLLSAYDNLTFIGDSLTACMVYTSQTQDRFARKKWGDIVARLSGANSDIYAVGGYTSTDAWNAYKDNIIAKDNQLYVVYLGTNGGLTDTVSTDCAGDDYTQYADTYTGNYGKILGKIKSLGKKAILVKVYAPLAIRDLTNKVIDDFGEKFDFPVIESIYNKDYCYHCYPDKTGINEVHYNDLGYTYFAYEFIKRVDELSDEEKTKLIN